MNRWIQVLVLALCSATAFAQYTAEDDFNTLSADDQALLIKAIRMVDDDMAEAVLPDFDYLVEKYPQSYLVRYERAYNLYLLGRYSEVLRDARQLLDSPCANERTYQLIGNAYDMAGDAKQAAKVYREGLKRFPQSGSLHMELGTLYLLDGDYTKAVEYYNQGILAEPNFASNYYRAAKIYLASDAAKVWGLVYAETAILLAPSDQARHQELADMMAECLKESITLSFDDESKLSVKLTPAREMKIDEKTRTVYLGFPGIYEAAIMKPLMQMQIQKVPFTCSLPELIELRKGIVDNYYAATDNLYGSSMYLLEFQKKIIEAGHWDAYNYFLFMQTFPDEVGQWYADHESDLFAFIEWFNADHFTLGDGRSVDILQIYNHYRPLTLPEALRIQASLLTSKIPTE